MENGVLLVIGASSDIGRAYIGKYSDRYARIIGTYNSRQDGLLELKEKLGDKLEMQKVNLLDEAEIDAFINWMVENNMLPDYVLHLPAQQSGMVRGHQTKSETLIADFTVSTVAFLRILSKVLPSMQKKQFGRICCMLSSVVESPVAFKTTYIVSKFSLLGAVKALAAEYAGKKITVNAVSPSMINTHFVAGASEMVIKKNIEVSPLRRLAEPEDIIRAMAFLLEDDNEYINGENILIAGGGIIS